MDDRLLERHRVEIIRLAAHHGAHNVRVFGSRARGQGGEQSDVDLLVELEKGRTLLDLVRLKRELEELTHREVDVVTDRGRDLAALLREEILSQAVPL
jgi:predicted nucleotidyltransferase